MNSIFTNSTVDDCNKVDLPRFQTESGSITALNNNVEIEFECKRVYYLYDVPGGEERGGHAHKELYQLIVAITGSFDVVLNDGVSEKVVHLNKAYQGLLIVPGIWRVLNEFSTAAVCLVLASHDYSEEDYLRDFEKFSALKMLTS